jgi:hypothetical protein
VQCEANSVSGQRCRANALRGTRRCALHSGRARELGRKGGSARPRLTVQDVVELVAPENAMDCRKLLGIAIAEVRTRRMTTSMAHAIASLAGVFLKAADQADLELRVSRLEQLSEERNAGRPN